MSARCIYSRSLLSLPALDRTEQEPYDSLDLGLKVCRLDLHASGYSVARRSFGGVASAPCERLAVGRGLKRWQGD
jgi:hypothetical protein